MLKIIGSVLAELRLAPPDATFRYNINIGTGLAISVSVFVDNDKFFQIKVSEPDDLLSEYHTQVRAWKQYGPLVPEPLAYRVIDGWHIFVMQGVAHTPFPHNALGGHIPPLALEDLLHYFQIGANQRPSQFDDKSHQLLFTKLTDHFIHTQYADLASRWIDYGRLQGCEALPLIAQHGDFVQNNLVISGDRLVIFDWEDFDKFHLPGLDICSLCVTLAPDVNAVRDLMCKNRDTARPMETFLRRACAISGLDVELFRRLIPLYLLVFLYIKYSYGQSAQDRFGTLLRDLSS